MNRPRRRFTWLLVSLLASALVLAACSSAGANGGGGGGGSGAREKGGTVTVAYLPGTQPVYIFPIFPATDDTVQEFFWFVEQFWRPLYWFGNGAALSLNEKLSIAEPPVMSNGAGPPRSP